MGEHLGSLLELLLCPPVCSLLQARVVDGAGEGAMRLDQAAQTTTSTTEPQSFFVVSVIASPSDPTPHGKV